MIGKFLDAARYTNSMGMDMVRIEEGRFQMGSEGIHYDEEPVHEVQIGQAFYMSAFEVTNAQYEQYDPGHASLRGKLGFSHEDDEAVVFVNWHEATAFCRWLSEREGKPYRLPTEAEWEYACRAGTKTAYAMGEEFPVGQYKHQHESWYPDPVHTRPEFEHVPLTVGQFAPNAWGLYDMHGNVEEWVQDWYGPYEAGSQADPVGRADGDFRMTRGGSHSTRSAYLRSAKRLGTLPEDRSWMIGFRVVIGDMPHSMALPAAQKPLCLRDVNQEVPEAGNRVENHDPGQPFFARPKVYVLLEPETKGPFYPHNHVPAIVETANGDLLAVWFSCSDERSREMTLAGSRLRLGESEWEPASLFWDAPGRNMTGGALWTDGEGTIHHFTGLGAAATWGNLALVMRTSTDNGATWTKGRLLDPEHGLERMPIASAFRTQEGTLVLPCDAVTGGTGGTVIWTSADDGESWHMSSGVIAGIHAPVAQLSDGRLIAFGRGDNINEKMPKSISSDMGRTWSYSASEFDPITNGQRGILRKLDEGALCFVSFAKSITWTNDDGSAAAGSGLFVALSFDGGETWPWKRLVSDDRVSEPEVWNGGAWTGDFTMSPTIAEPKGYLTMVQGRNGLIHLISSRLHYSFNMKWIMTTPQKL